MNEKVKGLFEYLMAQQFGHQHSPLAHEHEHRHIPGTRDAVITVDAALYDAFQEGPDVVVRHRITDQEIHRYRGATLSGKFRAYEL